MVDGSIVGLIGVGFTAIAAMFGAALAFISKISDRQSQREIKATEEQQQEEAALRNEVKELRAETKELRKENGDTATQVVKLGIKVNRQSEMISTATPVMQWVYQGANPPTPHIPLLWQHHLAGHNKTES